MIGSAPFTVIGVPRQRASGGLKPDSDTDIYVPLNTSRARFGEWIRSASAQRSQTFELSRIVLLLRTDARVQETLPLIATILEPFHHRGAVEVVVVNPAGTAK
jgi:putative ABC transport system permease protein